MLRQFFYSIQYGSNRTSELTHSIKSCDTVAFPSHLTPQKTWNTMKDKQMYSPKIPIILL